MMAKTPGMLNPLAFSSEAELRAALHKQGEERGWTPMPSDDDDEDSSDDEDEPIE